MAWKFKLDKTLNNWVKPEQNPHSDQCQNHGPGGISINKKII
jgi:hypothetical protein